MLCCGERSIHEPDLRVKTIFYLFCEKCDFCDFFALLPRKSTHIPKLLRQIRVCGATGARLGIGEAGDRSPERPPSSRLCAEFSLFCAILHRFFIF